MAFNIEVTNPRLHPKVVPHRIVPVRFARAVGGFSDRDAPDLDDHGFVIPQDFCTAHGAVVGIIQNRTIRVKVIRDRLEPTAQIFPTVDDTSVVSIEHPVAGTSLNASDVDGRQADCIFLDGAATGSTVKETKVKLHFGAADGPVLAEMAVRVYPLLVIPVQAHAVSINGVAPSTTLDDVKNMFNRINRIYAQSGVRFALVNNLMVENVPGFARNGTVTLTNIADQQNTELQTVLRQRPARDSLNAYFFGHYFDTVSGLQDQVLGIAFSRDDANANPPVAATGFPGCQAGITVRDSNDILESSHTAAHEIGHALRLQHYDNGQGDRTRNDIWAHRCLMHNFVNLISTSGAAAVFKNSVARTQVGYGNYADGRIMSGQLLTTKKIAKIFQGDQIEVLRESTRNQTFAPI